MTGPPAIGLSTSTPDGARGDKAEACFKLQSCDGHRLVRKITRAEADYIMAMGLGYLRRSREVWLRDHASPTKGIAPTWRGSARPGRIRPVAYSHNDNVCAGFRAGKSGLPNGV